jgi:hypothetical protein
MTEDQPGSQGQEDFKQEDNAPINVKVRKSVASRDIYLA